MTDNPRGVTECHETEQKRHPVLCRTVPYRTVPTTTPSAVPSNSPPHSPPLGGAGGEAGRDGEYDGIYPRWEDRSSDIVPVRAWNRLKWKLDQVGLRLDFQADYRAESDELHAKHGLPLRGGSVLAGYDRELLLFKRWHLKAWGAEPQRWPWQPLPEDA